MQGFEVVFTCMCMAIIIYQVRYFLVQYAVMHKIELFYYSMFLLSVSIFYYAYVLPDIFNFGFTPIIKTVFSAIKLPFQFISNVFYILFIIYYLELQKTRRSIHTLCNYYKYYNLIFTMVFVVLGILEIESSDLFHLVTLVLLIGSVAVLMMLWRINTVYSKVILYGTSCTVIGSRKLARGLRLAHSR